MIEIICNGEGQTKGEKEKQTKNTAIRMPKNVKQIGDISSNRKIYIEDYAFTYIHSIAYGASQEEQAGVLLGECQKSGEEKCLFIKGVIKAKHLEEDGKQGIYFDERVWNGVYADVEKYFPNLEVVGWFAALPDVTAERMQYVKRLHLDNFAGNMKTMYLINKADKEENFYLYENGDLKKQKGYVCFYERNYEMQEYMLQKRGHHSVEVPEKDKVVKSIRTILQEKEEEKQQKRNTVFIYGISSFMIVVVLVIGINLMNSYEKMKNLDQSINSIAIQMSNLNDTGGENTAEVSGNVVSVNKLEGNVYPTQKEENSQSEAAPTIQQNLIEASLTEAAINTQNQEQNSQTEQSEEKTKQQDTEVKESSVMSTQYESYIVKEGDTIMSISKNHYGTVQKFNEIAELNNLDNADQLYVGQEIKLP